MKLPKVHTKDIAFYRDSDRSIFHQFGDEEVSDIERYARFLYAVKSFFKYLEGTHFPPKLNIPKVQGFGETYRNRLWIPRKGRPYILNTTLVNSDLRLVWKRRFRDEPVFTKFIKEIDSPPSGLELNVESASPIEEEFDKLASVFSRGCNDENWENRLPRLIA